MITFTPSGGALNVTAGPVSAAYPLPGSKGTDVLLSHLGAVAGEHVYFKFGMANVEAEIPAFDGGDDDSSALAAGSIQVRSNQGATHIAVISATDQPVSIECGQGG